MFEHSLLPFADGRERRRTRWIVGLSLSAQGVAVAVLVVMPLLYPAQLPPFQFAHMKTVELAPPKPPVPPKPVVVRAADAKSVAAPSRPAIVATGRATIAPRTPDTLAEPALLPTGGGRMPGGQLIGVIGAAEGPGNGPVVTVKPAISGKGTGLVRLSTGVTNGMLLAPIRPTYPQLAKMTRTEGTVVVTAIIDTQGRILSIRTLSGPAMLRPAAEDAVREARYKPYLLNGQPVAVETTISVNFRNGS